jgi:hypothetical protein
MDILLTFLLFIGRQASHFIFQPLDFIPQGIGPVLQQGYFPFTVGSFIGWPDTPAPA